MNTKTPKESNVDRQIRMNRAKILAQAHNYLWQVIVVIIDRDQYEPDEYKHKLKHRVRKMSWHLIKASTGIDTDEMLSGKG